MAAPTLLDTDLGTTGDGTLSGALLSGDLAIVVVCSWGTGGAQTSSVSGGGLTWTSRADITANNGGKHVGCMIYTAPVASGATPTITVTVTNNLNYAVELYRLPGGGFVQAKTGSGDTWTSNPMTFSITMNSAVSSSNGILQVFGITEAFDGQNTIEPASGWTELSGNEDGTLADLSYQTAWREGSTSTTVSTTFTKDEYIEAMAAVEFSMSAGTNISPAQASGSGAAQAPSVRTSPTISPANVSRTGAAQAPAIFTGVNISPAAASGSGAAQAPSLRTTATVAATTKVATGAAGSPTIQTVGGGATTITPSTAFGTGTAGQPELLGVNPPGVLWRIGGYPCPAQAAPSTGARMLANR